MFSLKVKILHRLSFLSFIEKTFKMETCVFNTDYHFFFIITKTMQGKGLIHCLLLHTLISEELTL